jgi:hypothetical protein
MGVATLELAEGEGDELELVVPVIGGPEVVEGGGTLVQLGVVLVLVEEGVGCSVVVVVGTGLLPKDQVPYMTPCASVPPKEWKRLLLKSKSPAPQLSHMSTTWAWFVTPLMVIVTISKQWEPPAQFAVLSATTDSLSEFCLPHAPMPTA